MFTVPMFRNHITTATQILQTAKQNTVGRTGHIVYGVPFVSKLPKTAPYVSGVLDLHMEQLPRTAPHTCVGS